MKKRNLNAIYHSPLPVEVVALPPLVPHNPISVAYYVYQLVFVPFLWGFKRRRRLTAYLELYTDSVSSYVSSIAVDSYEDMQELWKAGFFGKGTQSRSDPTWALRTAKRLQEASGETEIVAPEEVTARRRAARKRFKNARALAEQGVLSNPADSEKVEANEEPRRQKPTRVEDLALRDSEGNVRQLEKLQLTFQEAFFLAYALDIIDIYDDRTGDLVTVPYLLGLLMPDWSPDNSFIVNYVVYHHYRSHGWCVRNGVKFGVDYLLYRRGPPFSHAEFGVIVIPLYSNESKNQLMRRDWYWSSGVNRVVGGVKKTMVLCYVKVPDCIDKWHTVEELLKMYEVREVVLRRWIPSRNRD
ncbi:SEN2 subunit of the tRNA splicing endonuclease-like protein [Lipomyces tetrasporus]|uniref:tRNA-splicing endonuclease subunit Sen2 n=1 Tax=Lipomyces tetrasporus TaxID=54092 RepID=A0AAD7VS51_9ASCO|nr:SEN2 subunit of the tRNA splicing endonuclease-like protein [Lipomyces tetrasporus]KAJ8099968.1 SEN2 subunit of the tRNA splicing endonuclease-like protein [Lipomyces tetrasporus]